MYTKMQDYFSSQRKNIITENCFVNDLKYKECTFDLITSATSFYWTNGEDIVNKLQKLLSKNGVLAIYRYDFPLVPIEIREIIEYESKENWDNFRHERLRDVEYSQRIIRDSRLFSKIEISEVENNVQLSINEINRFFCFNFICFCFFEES